MTKDLHYELSQPDWEFCANLVDLSAPHVVLAPDGEPYLYRWYLVGGSPSIIAPANVMLHIQVESDPERPLHDHPWDNTSVIVSGAYDELLQTEPGANQPYAILRRSAGDVIHRPACWAHRLILPEEVRYTVTIFSTGPKIREWGFWYPDGWHHHARHISDRGVFSTHKEE